MNKVITLTFLLILTTALASSNLTDIRTGLTGARTLGMGGAFIAQDVGLQGTLVNPALLSVKNSSEYVGTWINQYGDLTRMHLGGSTPLGPLSVALNLLNERMDGIPETIWSDERARVVGSVESQKNILMVGLATTLLDFIHFGMNAHYHQYQLHTLTGTGWGLDAGVLLSLIKGDIEEDNSLNLNLAAAVNNLSGTVLSWSNGGNDTIPSEYRVGANLGFGVFGNPLAINIDLADGLEPEQSLQLHVGGEYGLFTSTDAALTPRVGYNNGALCAGMGMRYHEMTVDYGFSSEEYLGGVHRVTMGWGAGE